MLLAAPSVSLALTTHACVQVLERSIGTTPRGHGPLRTACNQQHCRHQRPVNQRLRPLLLHWATHVHILPRHPRHRGRLFARDQHNHPYARKRPGEWLSIASSCFAAPLFLHLALITPKTQDAYVPGGQTCFVESGGALGYTQAHSAFIPPGADQGNLAAFGNGGYYVYTKGTGWVACPVPGKEGVYQVFARRIGVDYLSTCVSLNIVTSDVPSGTIGAWQYP